MEGYERSVKNHVKIVVILDIYIVLLIDEKYSMPEIFNNFLLAETVIKKVVKLEKTIA